MNKIEWNSKHVPDIRVDKVSEISGVNAFDVLHVNCCQVMIVLACFLARNNNNNP